MQLSWQMALPAYFSGEGVTKPAHLTAHRLPRLPIYPCLITDMHTSSQIFPLGITCDYSQTHMSPCRLTLPASLGGERVPRLAHRCPPVATFRMPLYRCLITALRISSQCLHKPICLHTAGHCPLAAMPLATGITNRPTWKCNLINKFQQAPSGDSSLSTIIHIIIFTW